MFKLFARLKNWIHSSQVFTSKKNGIIHLKRSFGVWSIYVNGYHESTPLLEQYWHKALAAIPKNTHIKTVLLLGCCGGESLRAVYKRFPECSIISIEHDPVMIEIFEKITPWIKKKKHALLCLDAKDAVTSLSQTFDLILFDCYMGDVTSPLIREEEFLKNMRQRLNSRGHLLVNFFKRNDYIPSVNLFFSLWKQWFFITNHFAYYRHFGNGNIGDPVPSYYKDPHTIPSYMISSKREGAPISVVTDENNITGARWPAGPLWIEKYIGDEEPLPKPFPHMRIVIWAPQTHTRTQRGWIPFFTHYSPTQTGYTTIENNVEYHREWNTHAQRYRRAFLHQNLYSINEVDLQTFLKTFPKKGQYFEVWSYVQSILPHHKKIHKENLHLYCAFQNKDNGIAGGLATLDLPEFNQSLHVTGFLIDTIANNSVGTGLIDHWFKESNKHNISLLNFLYFHGEGDNNSWRGFSRFKSQFGTKFITYPRPLLKIIGGEGL